MTAPAEAMGPVRAEMQRLAEAGVHTLMVRFADLEGVAKGKLVPLAQMPEVVSTGAGFAGPSIVGTGLPRTGPRSEYYARADLARPPLPLPWWPGVALVVADGFVAGEPFGECPRQILKRQIARLAERGWTLKTGIEPEFFLLRREADGRWVPADNHDRLAKPSYDLKSLPRQAGFLHALRGALEAAGLTVLQLDHEDAHGQYEVNFAFDEALASADALMVFKQAAHALAEREGCVFSMMPKPFADQPGSGLHFHVSLWAGEQPLFADPAADLSPLGRQFVAGVLAHAAGLTALAAPTVNSYKRLTVGPSLSGTSWAPARVAHGPNNRTALVRTLPGRFEWRLPDASANPYLATAGLIAAGLDGIERGLDPGPGTAEDLFELDAAALRARGVPLLPQSLHQACDAFEADPTLTAALGPEATAQFLALKRLEATEHARHVSAWELERYAARF
jgi:glutamine synthetase